MELKEDMQVSSIHADLIFNFEHPNILNALDDFDTEMEKFLKVDPVAALNSIEMFMVQCPLSQGYFNRFKTPQEKEAFCLKLIKQSNFRLIKVALHNFKQVLYNSLIFLEN